MSGFILSIFIAFGAPDDGGGTMSLLFADEEACETAREQIVKGLEELDNARVFAICNPRETKK